MAIEKVIIQRKGKVSPCQGPHAKSSKCVPLKNISLQCVTFENIFAKFCLANPLTVRTTIWWFGLITNCHVVTFKNCTRTSNYGHPYIYLVTHLCFGPHLSTFLS